MGQFGIGQPVTRLEDPRLLKGAGQFLDDMNFPGQARGYVLRSPHAHAKIKSIDVEDAKKAPGVIAIYTGEDHDRSWLSLQKPQIPRTKPDGSPMFVAQQPALVSGTVKFVGDYVAFIVAETVDQAKDAAESIFVDYIPLPAVIDTATATDEETPAVWEDCPDNIAFMHEAGDKEAVDAAFARANHVVKQRHVINRLTTNAMEVRSCVGLYDEFEESFVLYTGTQGPHGLKKDLANQILNIPENKLRVISGDMGGGFGMKAGVYPEFTLCLWAAKELGRPIKWVAERSESILSDSQARDNVSDAELALDKNGKFLALRVRTKANLGAYYNADRNAFSAVTHFGVLSGTYTTPAIHDEITCVLSNKYFLAPYRGAGRPEAAYVMERMVDQAAMELGIDHIELRRRNMIPADAMPFKTGFVYTYDSGTFEENMNMALEKADYQGYSARFEKSKAAGKLRGIGISSTIELAQGNPTESSTISFTANGDATLVTGTKASGQGHETMFKQMLASKLGLESANVTFIDGDTDKIAVGGGTFGSRSTFMGGSAIMLAADKIIEKGKKIAGHIMEAGESDIGFADGTFTIAGTDRSVSLDDVVKAAFVPAKLPADMEVGLYETAVFKTPAPTFPNGCHVCEVEIDPETGGVKIVKYTVVDDVGKIINPLTLKGQIHGGIVQGLGQVLMEDLKYDTETGQMLTGSFMDYAMPLAEDFCTFDINTSEISTEKNPLGAKGGGEAGTVGALPAGMNAILDALVPLGITHLDLPATPEKVWQAIEGVKA